MRSLYAVQFEVTGAATTNSDAAAPASDAVTRTVVRWITDWYHYRKRMPVSVPKSGEVAPLPGHVISVSCVKSATSDVSNTVVTWSYPDEDDGNLLWHSRCEISQFHELTEFSFVLMLDSSQFVIAPVNFDLHRPRLIPALLTEFCCVYGGAQLRCEAHNIGADAVPDFVQNRLRAKERRLPVVLVSPSNETGKPLINATALASSLNGIAETYALRDKWASFALSESVGKLLSCYNGAVRVYWPDFGWRDDVYAPIYTPDRIRTMPSGALERGLFKKLAAVASFRFVPGPICIDATEFLSGERENEANALREAAKERGDYEELASLYAQENEKLRAEAKELAGRVDSLAASLEVAEQNLRAVWTTTRDEEKAEVVEAGLAAEQAEPEVESVVAAVRCAAEQFADTLRFTDRAFESAEDSPYKQPQKVLQALDAIHEICQARRQARAMGMSMGSLETCFIQKGFTYKPHESVTATGKWGPEYQMTYKHRVVSIEPHLALGKGGPDTCLRIHFFIDDDDGVFVVDHVGRHKTNTRT